MTPLEIERPWIKEGLGKKTFIGVIAVFIVTFILIISFNGIGGPTVNIQQINVNFKNINEQSYSIPYGKFTYSGGSTVDISVPISVNNGAQFTISSVSAQNGFIAKLDRPVTVDGSGVYEIPVTVEMPSYNYAGSLNLTFS